MNDLNSGMMMLTKDGGNRILIPIKEIDSIVEQGYGMIINTKAGNKFDVTESFSSILQMLGV